MKKQTLLLIAAGSMLAFAACKNEANVAGGFTQEQVDSIVNVRVAELQVAMQASNDSLINVLAQSKADSMIAAMKGSTPAKAPARTTTKPTTKPVEPAKPTTPTNTGKNNGQGTNTGKIGSSTAPQGTNTGKR